MITTFEDLTPQQNYEVHALLHNKTLHVYKSPNKQKALERIKLLHKLELEYMANFNV